MLLASVVLACVSREFGQFVLVGHEVPFDVGFVTYSDIVGH